MPPDWKPAVIEFPIETYRSNSASTGVIAYGRISSSLLQAAATRTSPRTAAEYRVVRIMSRRSSESDGHTGREQMGRELVETSVAPGKVHRAAPIALFYELIREIRVPMRRQRDSCAGREFVARAFGEQRRHELRRRGRGVIQVAAAKLDLRAVLVPGAE